MIVAYRQLHSACRTLHRHRPPTTTAPSSIAAAVSPPLPPPRRCCRRLLHRPASAIASSSSCAARGGDRGGGGAMPTAMSFHICHPRRHSTEDHSESSRRRRRRVVDEIRVDDDDDDDDEAPSGAVTSATTDRDGRRRRTTTTCGRVARRRRMTERRGRGEDAAHASSDGGVTNDRGVDDDMPPSREREGDDDTLFGVHIGNPIRDRYIQSLKKVNYPKTLAGWKTVFGQTWETYLWTFEGFLIKEKRRDENGNIIPDEEGDATAAEDGVADDGKPRAEDDNSKSLQDRATDAAGAITENLQRNMSTMKHETPKLLKLGQEVTGVSSKEELKVWVGEQLKLGTACLSEFMKGYRKGRDMEVDRMLHDYFRELDGEEKEGSTGGAAEDITGSTTSVARRSTRGGRRSWGRNARRKMKTSSARHEGAMPKDIQLSN